MLQIHIISSLGKQIISQTWKKKKKKIYSTFWSFLLDSLNLRLQTPEMNEGNTLVSFVKANAHTKTQAAKYKSSFHL